MILIGLGYTLFVVVLDSLIENVETVDWFAKNIGVDRQDIIDYGNAIGSKANFFSLTLLTLLLVVLVRKCRDGRLLLPHFVDIWYLSPFGNFT